MNEIVGDNVGGQTHFRLYATLTDNAVETLGGSREFSHSSDILGFHGEYSESYRLKEIPEPIIRRWDYELIATATEFHH